MLEAVAELFLRQEAFLAVVVLQKRLAALEKVFQSVELDYMDLLWLLGLKGVIGLLGLLRMAIAVLVSGFIFGALGLRGRGEVDRSRVETQLFYEGVRVLVYLGADLLKRVRS